MTTLSHQNNITITITTMEELNTYVTEYMGTIRHIEQVKQELQRVRKSFQSRLEPLEKRIREMETLITHYFVSNDMKGIRKNGYSLYLDKKFPLLSREDWIRSFLSTRKEKNPNDLLNVDTMTTELVKGIKQRPRSEDDFLWKLKLVPLQKS